MERLSQALARGEPTALLGEAGIGKTSLLLAAADGHRAYIGGGLGMLSFVPYLSLSRALGALPITDDVAAARVVISRVAGGLLVVDVGDLDPLR